MIVAVGIGNSQWSIDKHTIIDNELFYDDKYMKGFMT